MTITVEEALRILRHTVESLGGTWVTTLPEETKMQAAIGIMRSLRAMGELGYRIAPPLRVVTEESAMKREGLPSGSELPVCMAAVFCERMGCDARYPNLRCRKHRGHEGPGDAFWYRLTTPADTLRELTASEPPGIESVPDPVVLLIDEPAEVETREIPIEEPHEIGEE